MALTLNMVGGGSGGGSLLPTDAILRVQAPAGSTVTISKGGVSKSDAGHENADDNTVYDYYFIIHQSQFDSVNPWAVVSTLSIYSKSQTVIIDTADEYNLVVTYSYYLIKDGQVLIDFTGQEITSGSTYATMARSGNVAFLASTSIAYNTTLFSKLIAVIPNSSGMSYSQQATCPSFGVGSTAPTINSSSAAVSNYTAYKQFNVSNSHYIQSGTYTIDVSSLTGDYYIALACSGTGNYNGALYISDLYFEQ